MKRKLISLLCLGAIFTTSIPSARADTGDPEFTVLADVAVVRPLCLAATAVGSALFVISLPISSLTRSVRKTARTLVVRPARATFTRPIGDMEALRE